MADVTTVIGSGETHTTIASWETNVIPANLVTDGNRYIGKLKNQGFTANWGDFSGHTCDDTNYIWLTTDTGASFIDNMDPTTDPLRYDTTKGAYLSGAPSDAGLVWVETGGSTRIKVSNLMLRRTGASYNRGAIDIRAGTWARIENCIIESNCSVLVRSQLANVYLDNCACYVDQTDQTAFWVMEGTQRLSNCTVVQKGGSTTGYVSVDYGFMEANDSAFFGFASGWNNKGDAGTGNYNATQRASGVPGANTLFSRTILSEIENITSGTHDLRPKSTATMVDATTGLSTDIFGNARPGGGADDIGAVEYEASMVGGGLETTLDAGAFTFTGGTATGATYTTTTLDPGSFTFTGGEATGVVTGTGQTIDTGNFAFVGGDVSATWVTTALTSGNFAFRGGSVQLPSEGGRYALVRNVTHDVVQPVVRAVTGGSVAANPSQPAGDAIQQLLDTMSSGQIARINNRSYNIYTGPNKSRGYSDLTPARSLYSRDLYDLGYMKYPGVTAAYCFASETNLREHIMGAVGGGGSTTDDRAQLIYGGMGYSFYRNIILLAGGGHSSGAGTHVPFFDVVAACNSRRLGNGGGLWDQFSDPAPYGRSVTQGAGEGNIYPPYGRDSNWPALAEAFDSYYYPQPIDHDLFPEWYTPIASAVNGDGDCPPYATHSSQAIEYDDVNDQLWRCGYNVALGNNGTLNSGSAGGTCTLDYATRSWTRRTGSGLGGSGGGGPYFRMAPNDENYMFVRINAFTLGLLNIAAGTTATVGTGNGDSADIGYGGLTLIENLHTVGYWALAFFRESGAANFSVEPKAWPVGAAVDRVVLPSGGYTGATQVWNNQWGMDWCPVDKKIYVAGFDPNTPYAFKMQAVDPFQGNATGQTTWAISDVALTGLAGSGDLPEPINPVNYTEREMYNRFRYLPDYDAFIAVMGYQYGDVYLIKR